MRAEQGPAAPAVVTQLAGQGPHQPESNPAVPKRGKQGRSRGGSWVQLLLPTCLISPGKFTMMGQVQGQAEKSVCGQALLWLSWTQMHLQCSSGRDRKSRSVLIWNPGPMGRVCGWRPQIGKVKAI